DFLDVVQGVVVAGADDRTALIVMSSQQANPKPLAECFRKVGALQKRAIVASQPDARGVVEFRAEGRDDQIYVAFPRKDVVAVTPDPSNRDLLLRWIAGKGVEAKSELGRGLAGGTTAAAAWGATGKAQELDSETHLRMAYGSAGVAAGIVIIDGHAVLASTQEAAATVAKLKKEIAQ